jgi:hypothetical protein
VTVREGACVREGARKLALARQEQGGEMRKAAVVTGVAVLLAVLVALLGACESPAAQRERAAAERIRAEAAAESERIRAQTEAVAERAAIRQAERDAAHQRTLDVLPYVLAIGGGVLLAGAGLLVFWDLRRQAALVARPGSDVLLLARELQRLELIQARRDRELWRALGRVAARGELPPGGRVVIYE